MPGPSPVPPVPVLLLLLKEQAEQTAARMTAQIAAPTWILPFTLLVISWPSLALESAPRPDLGPTCALPVTK
jgi:hypothetical protein